MEKEITNQSIYDHEKKIMLDICPEYLLDLAEDYDLIISGGMITSLFCNRDVQDIDVYMKNEADVFPLVSELLNNSTLISVTDKSLLVNHSGQLINLILFKTFESSYEIFKSFDFTVCMGAYDISDDAFYFHEDFFKHNSQRVLSFNSNTDFPLVSALRIKKYTEKGYSISKLEYVRVLLSCVGLNIDSYESLESHVGGMYGLHLDELIDTTVEFDLSHAISQLSNPNRDIDDVKKLVWNDPQDDVDAKIKSLLSKFAPVGVKKIPKHDLIVYPSGRVSFLSEFLDPAVLDEHEGFIYLYKYVKKTNTPTTFASFYRESFTYEMNQEIVDLNHGIYCGILESKSNFTYSNNQNKLLIKLKVEVDDIISIHGGSQCKVKRAVVSQVMSDEYVNEDTNNHEQYF